MGLGEWGHGNVGMKSFLIEQTLMFDEIKTQTVSHHHLQYVRAVYSSSLISRMAKSLCVCHRRYPFVLF